LAIWLAPPGSLAQEREAGAAPAAEATPGREPPPEALEHYTRGRALYKAGRYREALTELNQALALDPDSPNLVYNVARVYELLGEIDLAIEHYVRYQKLLSPDQTDEIARVQSTLQRLEGAREQVAPEPSPGEPVKPAPAPTRQHGVADAAFWTLASTAAAALASGAATGVLALGADQEARSFVIGADGDSHDLDKKAQRADRLALASDISLLAGATLGVTAILMYALRTKPVREAAAPGPRIVVELGAVSRGTMLSIRGRL
jgi:tetratricopeptide (TPR) repeat protein